MSSFVAHKFTVLKNSMCITCPSLWWEDALLQQALLYWHSHLTAACGLSPLSWKTMLCCMSSLWSAHSLQRDVPTTTVPTKKMRTPFSGGSTWVTLPCQCKWICSKVSLERNHSRDKVSSENGSTRKLPRTETSLARPIGCLALQLWTQGQWQGGKASLSQWIGFLDAPKINGSKWKEK